jgi:hypothetical protein
VLGLLTNSISIAELATLITAAGVGIYALGLVGVALAIYLTFTDDSWSTAWYAASLMPRVVVAGQGMRLWSWGMLSVLATLVGLIGVILFLVAVGTLMLSGQAPEPQVGVTVTVIVASVVELVSGLLWYVVARRRPTASRPQSKPLSHGVYSIMVAVGITIVLITAYVMWQALEVCPPRLDPQYSQALESCPQGAFEIKVTDWDSMAVGALLLMLGVFIWGVPLAGAINHPLPMVDITVAKPEGKTSPKAGEKDAQGTPESQEARVHVRGWLVAYIDSCWHLFTSERPDNRAENERGYLLLSIPDDRVSEAQVYEDDTLGPTS